MCACHAVTRIRATGPVGGTNGTDDDSSDTVTIPAAARRCALDGTIPAGSVEPDTPATVDVGGSADGDEPEATDACTAPGAPETVVDVPAEILVAADEHAATDTTNSTTPTEQHRSRRPSPTRRPPPPMLTRTLLILHARPQRPPAPDQRKPRRIPSHGQRPQGAQRRSAPYPIRKPPGPAWRCNTEGLSGTC